MSTRSLISVVKNGVVYTSYCHFDGYLGGVGKTLVDGYDTQGMAEALVLGGDMRSVEPYLDMVERYRDSRGPRILVGDDISPGYYNCGQDYEYLFRDGEWLYREADTHGGWYSVAAEMIQFEMENEDE